MKGAARLSLFYIVTFAFFLAASVAFSVIRGWSLTATGASSGSFSAILTGIASLATVLPMSVYGAVLSSFSYSSRHGIGSLVSALVIFTFSALILVAFSYGGNRLETYRIVESKRNVAEVDSTTSRSITVTRYQDGSAVAHVGGVAVVAPHEGPLRIAPISEGPEYALRSPRIDPFAPSLAVPASIAGLADAFSATGRRLSATAGKGILALLIYAAALSFLMVSFRFLAGSTRWPFADFVLCAVALRGVVAYDEFLATGVVRRFLAALFGSFLAEYSAPIALTAAGVVVELCSLLSSAAGKRRKIDA